MYCTIEDVFKSCVREAVEHWARDSREESEIDINERIESAIQSSVNEMNLYLAKKFPLPILSPPSVLRDICVKFTLYQLLSRKGLSNDSSEQTIKDNKEYATRQLEWIASGRLELNLESEGSEQNNSTKGVSYFFPNSNFGFKNK